MHLPKDKEAVQAKKQERDMGDRKTQRVLGCVIKKGSKFSEIIKK